MELRTFIAQSLQDIVFGILDAQNAVKAAGSDAVVSPEIVDRSVHGEPKAAGRYQPVTMIRFDIAVVASTAGTVEATGKGGIKVWPFGAAEASAAANVNHERGHESRLAFEIPIALPRLRQLRDQTELTSTTVAPQA